ncbi:MULTISPECIES: glycosyltransferase family 4 protein [Pseudomonas syringae group]|uniref:Glycosyltransferase family 4 protein n=1 Tax=Pseudomonas lijiangensis TaxID=2995658 RepID=A0ABX8HRQ3_9PSED|nr:MULTISPECIES: glycosyltransferase family 4 protein [Pseudomonas syringae group]MBX8484521.1 glycosyltransferase family 4 protein [Pseudomonas cichorii]MBX8491701.1 glycosyltransferase family 4 protein [Pseudomonas cichorii]MBX8500725.1 glycosyltransferase family 4 protein [Pseudomonas lijiangensis]MBX8504527.1 glycosyltransferase family 4 protein [Pseudomonas lijiangensis]MBX8514365.1 glycosyltransferase family 4 protein [Pseudomonas cichorii]
MAEKALKVLVVTQYFWPENMRINDLVRDLSAKGHEVTVLTGLPNYPEGKVFESYREKPEGFSQYCGAEVIRVPLVPRGKRSLTLVLNYLSFFISASTLGAFKLRGRKFDTIFVYAVSPVMAAIPALVIGWLKRAPVFVWVLDLWPETLRAVGVLKQPLLLGWVGKVVSWIYNRTDYLLLQSHGFLDNVRRYCTRPITDDRLVYFPSWAEDDFSSSSPPMCDLIKPDPNVFTVVFAGNLGEAQDFPAVLDAAESLRASNAVRWVIVGDGRMSEWIAEQIATRQLDNVHLLGRHPLEAMPGLFAQADALLVSLKTNDVFEKTIPGKVQAYLASGRPILGMINGEAARVINESGAGFACDSGDAQGLAAITRALADAGQTQRESMGRAGRNYYEQHYAKGNLLMRLETLFRQATLRKVSQS